MTKDVFPHHAQFILDGDESHIKAALDANTNLARNSLRIHIHEGIVEIRAATWYAFSLALNAITKLGGRDVQHLPQEEEIPMDVPPVHVTFGNEDPDALAAAAE